MATTYRAEDIPPGVGAHLGGGFWAWRCYLCPAVLQEFGGPVMLVDQQRHTSAAHGRVDGILP